MYDAYISGHRRISINIKLRARRVLLLPPCSKFYSKPHAV